jgi:AraC-like DNA-binding protein
VPGTTLDRWLEQTLASRSQLVLSTPRSLVGALASHAHAGAIVLLDRAVLRTWPEVRQRLIEGHTPTIILAPLSVEALHALAFERELRLVALHVTGFEDSPMSLRGSLERLLNDGMLRRFLVRFGPDAPQLESLILPCWNSLAIIRSLESWADVLRREPEWLARQLRECGVRSPRRLLIWLRLLSAWPMLHAGRTAGDVSLAVGYSAPPAFTRSTRQFVGIPPSTARTVSLERLIDSAAADLVA